MLQTAAYNTMEKLVRCFVRGEFCDKNTQRIFRCVPEENVRAVMPSLSKEEMSVRKAAKEGIEVMRTKYTCIVRQHKQSEYGI